MRITKTLILSSLIVTVGAQCFARDLTAVTYGGSTEVAMEKAYLAPYSKETGESFVKDQDPGLAKIRAMVQAGNVTWDLVDQESGEATIGCDEGIFEKYDPSKLKLNGTPENLLLECGFPSYIAANIMAYDADRIKENPPTTWADFWDVKKWPGKRGIWNSPKGALEIALMADGVPTKDVYTELKKAGGVDRAFAKLDQLKPYILAWNTGAESVNRLAAGEYIMTFAWNSRMTSANETNNRKFKIVWEAGFTAVTSYWVTPKGSDNLNKVYDALAIVSSPERQAEFMMKSSYSTPNPGAYALLPKERLALLPMSPENAKFSVSVDDSFWIDNYDSLSERFNAWLAQ